MCVVVALALALGSACEDTNQTSIDDTLGSDAAGGDVIADTQVSTDTGPETVPLSHRAVAEACDGERASDPPIIDYPDIATCEAHSDCIVGVNGRCVGNSHDGWYCTYDECSSDDQCGGFVCECEGGFRSDYDVCLHEGNCLTDGDCGNNGYCSPTFGSCGAYSGTVGYYCHTPDDDCVDDVDCGGDGSGWGAYCAYNKIAGRWICEDSHCVG